MAKNDSLKAIQSLLKAISSSGNLESENRIIADLLSNFAEKQGWNVNFFGDEIPATPEMAIEGLKNRIKFLSQVKQLAKKASKLEEELGFSTKITPLQEKINRAKKGLGYDIQYGRDVHTTLDFSKGISYLARQKKRGAGFTVEKNKIAGIEQSSFGLYQLVTEEQAAELRRWDAIQNAPSSIFASSRGGTTSTEIRKEEPGLKTGSDFDYLRDIEKEQQEIRSAREERVNRWKKSKRTDHWQRVREDNLYRKDMESRHSRMRRQQQINLAYENMSEKERFIHENAPRFGGKAAAEGVWSKRERDTVLKGLPEFFKNSRLSTKTLQRISKAGSALGISRIAKNPVMLGASLGLGALAVANKAASGFMAGSSAATNIENWKKFTGGVSPSFMKAAALAGYQDVSSIASLYTELTSKYGDAELFLKSIGESTAGLSGIGKIRLAQSLGLNQTSIALAEILAGTFGNISKSRDEQARYTLAKIEADIMSSAESKLKDRLTGVFGQSMLGIGVYGTANEYANKHMFDEFKKASDAAESADVFESQSNSNIENVSNKTSSTGFYINNIDVHANDPGQFVSELEGIAKSHGINKNDVLDNADSRMVA